MKKNKTILIVGACGSGKTWVCKQLIKHYKIETKAKIKSIYFNTNNDISVLGKFDNTTFEGTDKLSMSIMKDVDYLRYIQRKHNMTIISEGDRFTNKTFIQKFRPYIIKIEDDGLQGRKKRKSNQTKRQIKSIQTRVNNIQEDILIKNSNKALELIKTIIDENI